MRNPRTAMAAFRDELATTPGRLTAILAALVAAALCFGAVAAAVEHSRAQAVETARTATEPLLVDAALLYRSLADANATATATFLHGGLEPQPRRAYYLLQMRAASDSLARLARGLGARDGAPAAVLIRELPIYTGLIEAARANNRQGLPVGAAYLREASGSMNNTILPRANQLFTTQASRLTRDYETATTIWPPVALIVTAAGALALLIRAQRHVARISGRRLNLPLLLACAAVTAIAVWSAIAMVSQQHSVRDARSASDRVELLAATSVLLSRALSDQSLTLVNRGSDTVNADDLDTVLDKLNPSRSLMREVGAREPAIAAAVGAYRAETQRIADLVRAGEIPQAIDRSSTERLNSLDAQLERRVTAARKQFASATDGARSALAGLAAAIIVLTVLTGALAYVGMRARLAEYR